MQYRVLLRHAPAAFAALAALAAACADPVTPPAAAIGSKAGAEDPVVGVERAFGVATGPGNLTITPDGRFLVSLHQNYTPVRELAEVRGAGLLVNYPARGEGVIPVGLEAVLGIRSDTAGVLYLLDNGNQGLAPPKLVVFDSRTETLVRTVPLASVSDTNSFPNDLAFDYRRNHLYVSDPAGGYNAAIIVVNLATGQTRRVLQGDVSVVNETRRLVVEGDQIQQRLPDGTVVQPAIGVDGIAIDYQNEWVYYGPFQSNTMYRVRAADLADPGLSPSDLAARVERYSDKPYSDGMAIDGAGNLYLGDVEGNAIGVIEPRGQGGRYRELARGPEYRWVDDFEFGTDGYLYVVTTQLHLSPTFNLGVRAAEPPFLTFRLRPLAPGQQGR